MGEFDLDLSTIEEEMEENRDTGVILGVLDGSTPGEEWMRAVATGKVLVLSIDGNLTELAAEFAPEVKDAGGSVVHFRDFLIVSPPDVEVDTERL